MFSSRHAQTRTHTQTHAHQRSCCLETCTMRNVKGSSCERWHWMENLELSKTMRSAKDGKCEGKSKVLSFIFNFFKR